MSANKEIFKEAIRLFNRKWSEETVFLDYFNKEWIHQLDGWYEGHAPEKPSTDIGLEAVNLQVKKEYMFGNRTPVGQFLEIVKQKIVHDWSTIRNPANINYKPNSHTPVYTLEDETKAYQWLLKNKSVQAKTIDFSLKLNFVASELNWNDLDHLLDSESSIWCIVLQEDDWKSGNCSCFYFAKYYKCKHLLCLSYNRKLHGTIISETAKQIPLGQKRRKGAPTKAKRAFERQ